MKRDCEVAEKELHLSNRISVESSDQMVEVKSLSYSNKLKNCNKCIVVEICRTKEFPQYPRILRFNC